MINEAMTWVEWWPIVCLYAGLIGLPIALVFDLDLEHKLPDRLVIVLQWVLLSAILVAAGIVFIKGVQALHYEGII